MLVLQLSIEKLSGGMNFLNQLKPAKMNHCNPELLLPVIAPLHIFLAKAWHNKFSQKRNVFANLQQLNRHSGMTYSVPKQVVSPE